VFLGTILFAQNNPINSYEIVHSKNNTKITAIQRNGFRKDQKELNNSRDVLNKY
jgi:hypothetical protein